MIIDHCGISEKQNVEPLYSGGFFHTFLYNKYGTAHCVHRYHFLNYDVFLSLNVVLILADSADLGAELSSGSSLFVKVPV